SPARRLGGVPHPGRRVVGLEGGRLVPPADLSRLATFHANDMVVDRAGRAYVGNFGYDYETGAPFTAAVLALVHPDGRVEAVADDLAFPNGTGITPGGRTLVLPETVRPQPTAFTSATDG